MIEEKYGSYLKTLIKNNNVKQKEILDKLNISKTYLFDIEKSNNLPPTVTKQLALIECFKGKLSNSEEKKLLELAAIEREEVPADIMNAIFDKEKKKINSNLIEKIRKIINK